MRQDRSSSVSTDSSLGVVSYFGSPIDAYCFAKEQLREHGSLELHCFQGLDLVAMHILDFGALPSDVADFINSCAERREEQFAVVVTALTRGTLRHPVAHIVAMSEDQSLTESDVSILSLC